MSVKRFVVHHLHKIDAADAPHEGTIVIDGIESPQALLVDSDRVLVMDHETGTIFSLTES